MTTITHAPKIAQWIDKTHAIIRYRYRHRCSCGHKDPERADIQMAEYDQRVHLREVAA